MRVLAIVHQPEAGPGVFADAIAAAGVPVDLWMPPDQDAPPRDLREYGAVITLGGAMHVDQDREHPWIGSEKALLSELWERGVPLLGVCLGAQLLAAAAGASVHRARLPEIGWYEVTTTAHAASDPLLAALAPGFEALEWHSYEFETPPGAVALAHSDVCQQAYRLGENAWGIQFHAEVSADALNAWIDDYRSDPEAAAMELAEVRRLADARLPGWNRLGRELCARFVDYARRRI